MLRHACWSAIALIGLVASAGAQTPAAAGTWAGSTMIGPKDSVVATYVLMVAPDGKSATMKFPNRDPIPARIVAIGGDSIVTEAGPYPSVLRPGQTVKLLRNVAHVRGSKMSGTFEAQYNDGSTVKGKTQATRTTKSS